MYVIWAALAFAAIQVREYFLAVIFFSNEILNYRPGHCKYAQDGDSLSLYLVWGINEDQSKGSEHFNTELLNHVWSNNYCYVDVCSVRLKNT